MCFDGVSCFSCLFLSSFYIFLMSSIQLLIRCPLRGLDLHRAHRPCDLFGGPFEAREAREGLSLRDLRRLHGRHGRRAPPIRPETALPRLREPFGAWKSAFRGLFKGPLEALKGFFKALKGGEEAFLLIFLVFP